MKAHSPMIKPGSTNWSPFKKNGKLRIVFYSDPWWKRLWARLRGEPLWHRMGALRDGD